MYMRVRIKKMHLKLTFFIYRSRVVWYIQNEICHVKVHKKIMRTQDEHHWQPDPDEIQRMFEALEKSRVLDISWQCPGRKHPPSDDNNIADQEDEEQHK